MTQYKNESEDRMNLRSDGRCNLLVLGGAAMVTRTLSRSLDENGPGEGYCQNTPIFFKCVFFPFSSLEEFISKRTTRVLPNCMMILLLH